MKAEVPQNITPLYFFSSNILYFGQTMNTFWDFRVLGSKFLKFLMSILNWQVDSTSIFASFFTAMTHNSPINFKLIHFNFGHKTRSDQSPNFETFKCSDENLPNSSCHFWRHKSVFLQILYQSELPSNIRERSIITSR